MEIDKAHDGAFGDRFTVDFHPFAIGYEMGRRKQPDFVAGGPQDGIKHRGGRAFAVGSGDMDSLVAILRTTKFPEKFGDILKPEFHSKELSREKKPFGRRVGMTQHQVFLLI